MAETTERLIEQLAAQAVPVGRLRAPLLRAASWLCGTAVIAGLAVLWLSDLDEFALQMRDPKLMLETVAALATGIVAIVAAFHLSVPDRSPRWAFLPLPPLALWVASSGYACYQNWIVVGSDGWEWGESATCFQIIVGISVPLAVTLLILLRRARPLNPVRVAAVAGLGVAAVAAFLLRFFHPFDVTFMDLSVHAVAIGLVVAASSWSGRVSTPA